MSLTPYLNHRTGYRELEDFWLTVVTKQPWFIKDTLSYQDVLIMHGTNVRMPREHAALLLRAISLCLSACVYVCACVRSYLCDHVSTRVGTWASCTLYSCWMWV